MEARKKIKKHRVIGLTLILALMAAIALFVGFRSSHFWRKVPAGITYNADNINKSVVYRSPITGNLLVRLENLPYERSLFVIDVVGKKIGLPNEDQFVILPNYAYSKETSPTLVYMKSATADTDPELKIEDNEIGFTTSSGGRIKVTLR